VFSLCFNSVTFITLCMLSCRLNPQIRINLSCICKGLHIVLNPAHLTVLTRTLNHASNYAFALTKIILHYRKQCCCNCFVLLTCAYIHVLSYFTATAVTVDTQLTGSITSGISAFPLLSSNFLSFSNLPRV
jgi:hypothetical protein